MGEKEKYFAVLFADVVGSTQLYEVAGDIKAMESIDQIESLMSSIVEKSSGVVVDVIGDEIMCRFTDTNEAARAACNIQKAIEELPPVNGIPLSVRIGLHYGPVIMEDDRMFGDTVNIAARMVEIAKGKQIIMPEQTVQRLSPDVSALARKFDRVKIKGKQQEITIYDILWQREGVTTMISGMPAADPEKSPELVLVYRGEEKVIPVSCSNFSIGRAMQCDLVIDSSFASRNHARLEYRRGKFVLIDQSTNGTFVRTNDGEMIYLRREALPLWGNGMISLGKKISDNEHTIRYLCP